MVCLLKIDMKSCVFVIILYSNYCLRKLNLKIVLDLINSIYWFYSLKKKIKKILKCMKDMILFKIL